MDFLVTSAAAPEWIVRLQSSQSCLLETVAAVPRRVLGHAGVFQVGIQDDGKPPLLFRDAPCLGTMRCQWEQLLSFHARLGFALFVPG